jgi:hypothetical protein
LNKLLCFTPFQLEACNSRLQVKKKAKVEENPDMY